jgi:hypothetical protein
MKKIWSKKTRGLVPLKMTNMRNVLCLVWFAFVLWQQICYMMNFSSEGRAKRGIEPMRRGGSFSCTSWIIVWVENRKIRIQNYKRDLKPQSTYKCRVQSCVWRLSKYWPPTPLSTQRECPTPAPKAGVHTRRAVRGVNILEDARHRIGLLQYNLSTL